MNDDAVPSDSAAGRIAPLGGVIGTVESAMPSFDAMGCSADLDGDDGPGSFGPGMAPGKGPRPECQSTGPVAGAAAFFVRLGMPTFERLDFRSACCRGISLCNTESMQTRYGL